MPCHNPYTNGPMVYPGYPTAPAYDYMPGCPNYPTAPAYDYMPGCPGYPTAPAYDFVPGYPGCPPMGPGFPGQTVDPVLYNLVHQVHHITRQLYNAEFPPA
ncbi:MAG: hypothetical protein ACOYVD_02620 [Bacillota bacterium]